MTELKGGDSGFILVTFWGELFVLGFICLFWATPCCAQGLFLTQNLGDTHDSAQSSLKQNT